MRAIERRNRNQVECSECYVKLDSEDEHQLKDGCGSREGVRSRSDGVHQHDERYTEHGDHQICHDARKRDDDVSALEVPEIAGIHRHGLGAAEDWSVGDEKQERQDDRHEGIDMLCRIPGEPAQLISCGIAVLQGCIPVGILVRDHREQQNGRNQNEILYLAQSGECWVFLPLNLTSDCICNRRNTS